MFLPTADDMHLATPSALARINPDVIIRRLMVFGIIVALGMLGVGVVLLYDSRNEMWERAGRSSANLVQTLEREIARNIAIYDLSLVGAIDALDQPGIKDVSPGLRQAAIFDRAASAEFLGSLLVLDRTGNITYDSTSIIPHQMNFGDRDYFLVHRDSPNRGLFLSESFRSRLRNNDPSIAISRRLSGPSGEFRGVVVGTLRLAYFQQMFSGLDLGRDGSVLLLGDDGRLVVRHPMYDQSLSRDFNKTALAGTIAAGGAGQVIARSTIDGVERVFDYRRVGTLPLHVAVGASVSEVLAPWWRKAVVIGGIMALLAAAAVVLLMLFHRELTRRRMAEASLMQAARRLELAAKTDSLTALPNRRAFQESLDAIWRSACRTGGVLSMLMIDADGFKMFNDRYGHQEGDRALRAVSSAIRNTLHRPGDVGARYGGEEFAVLLPDTELGAAVALAERIRCAVRDAAIPHVDGPDGFVTVSIGVSTVRPQTGEHDRILVRTADAALYDAKHAGRNRVCANTAGSCMPVPTAAATRSVARPDPVTPARPRSGVQRQDPRTA